MHESRPYIQVMTQPALVSAEDLERLTPPNTLSELVRGVMVVREPPGFRHGLVTTKLAKRLIDHVDAHGQGQVLAADTGFTLFRNPDTVRAPDVAFVRHDRVPEPPPTGYAEFAPDLVVEVLSPNDRPGEVLAKVADWLTAGTRLVWVLDPERRCARVYRADGSEALIPEDGTLEGEDVLPGFSCRLGDTL
jgi:Uma2 family endonuclease